MVVQVSAEVTVGPAVAPVVGDPVMNITVMVAEGGGGSRMMAVAGRGLSRAGNRISGSVEVGVLKAVVP